MITDTYFAAVHHGRFVTVLHSPKHVAEDMLARGFDDPRSYTITPVKIVVDDEWNVLCDPANDRPTALAKLHEKDK